ncbi:MAG: hypothetical protein P1P64_03390 [Treponemataceae bacterium]
MIITKNEKICNSRIRLKPSKSEGKHIQYQLQQNGLSYVTIATKLDVAESVVLRVVSGERRSRKIEAEIARLLGRESWNDVVIEARLATSNPAYRPTQKDIDEYKEQITLRLRERSVDRMKQIGIAIEAKQRATRNAVTKTAGR